jgi:hypothetical protein
MEECPVVLAQSPQMTAQTTSVVCRQTVKVESHTLLALWRTADRRSGWPQRTSANTDGESNQRWRCVRTKTSFVVRTCPWGVFCRQGWNCSEDEGLRNLDARFTFMKCPVKLG